jgi:hypothetical protein
LRAWHALLAGLIVGILVVFIETLAEIVKIVVALVIPTGTSVELDVVALIVPTGTFVELGVVALNVMLDVDGALDVRLDKELGDAFDDCEGAGVT